MSGIKLYIATSIDGYIARPNNQLDWLAKLPNLDKTDYGYQDFYAGIDTVVMGRKTYEEVLGFDVDWPYAECTTYVATTRKDYVLSTPNTELLPLLNEDTHQVFSHEFHEGAADEAELIRTLRARMRACRVWVLARPKRLRVPSSH
ncbi:MAG: hypothetical protein GVY26_17145 [Bacteroidetes bacterium]|jgi:dihydrofolate reductase|nr:hypothetical protein [Bacteroidota bacterium]